MTALAAPLDTADTRVIAQKYRLEALLSEGGMGSVWRAFNLQLEVPVAIKLLRPGLNSDELCERLRVEARAVAKLVHPSIVRVFDIGESESGEPFIVMELLNGESLGDLLTRGALPAINAVQLLLPIVEALSLAHSRGVIHRDLKPDNIFLAREGDSLQPKLLDFGIAKVTSGRGVVSQTGTVMGSPNYMSPEQAYGHSDIDHRADVWSFCVVMHEAITGRPVFSGDTVASLLRSVVQDDPLPLEVAADIDRQLSDIVQSGLNRDREQRPGSISELGQQLAAWLVDQGVHEDGTGASLETKWLGRSSDRPLPQAEPISAPRAQHDDATLVSVVHPRVHPSTIPKLPLNRRGRRWLPSAILAFAGLSGWLGWTSLREFRHEGEAVALASPARVSTPQPASRVAAGAPALPIEALPVEPPAPAAEPPAPATPRVTTTLAARTALARPAPRSARLVRGSLPASLPPAPQLPPPRDPAADLLNPY